jgi:hypothetical protein
MKALELREDSASSGEFLKRSLPLIDNHDAMAGLTQAIGQKGPQSPAANNDNIL